MLNALTAARIAGIARDRDSGAAELALRAADALSQIAPDEIAEAAQAVMRAQPAMAAVYNAARAALDGRLPDFVDRLRQSGEAIARGARELTRDKMVLTHSYSSTIIRALSEARPARIVCTESLPGGEGRRTAAALGAEVIADAAVYTALAAVDIVVVGADAVTPGVIVNKIGTALVALAARERRKPAWVLCGEEKFVPASWQPEFGDLFEATPRGWFAGICSGF